MPEFGWAARQLQVLTLHRTATSWAASMAAYGEDSSRSAFTFIPPVMRHIVSLPDRSVTCTNAARKKSLRLMYCSCKANGQASQHYGHQES